MSDVAVPETLVYECLRSSPSYFDKKNKLKKKTIYKVFSFLSEDGGGRTETCINVCFRP